MKIPLHTLGIAFKGDCLGCGVRLKGDPEYACTTTYCFICRVAHNRAITVHADPLPKTRTGVVIVPPELDTYGREPAPAQLTITPEAA